MNGSELKSLIAAYKPKVARQPAQRKTPKPRTIRHRVIEPKQKSGIPSGRLECPMCEKSFVIRGVPGDVTSSAYGLDETDILMRKAGL